MTEIPGLYDSLLSTTAQHLATCMRDTWTVTVVLVAVGSIATLALLTGGARPLLVAPVFGSTLTAFFGGVRVHVTFRRGLVQILDRMSPDAAVRVAAANAVGGDDDRPPGIRGLLARLLPKH